MSLDATTTAAPSRRGLVEALRHRRLGGLTRRRAQHRTSAFVYGNITVLGAVVAANHADIADGRALLAVGATAFTTFVAHVVADQVADRVTTSRADPGPDVSAPVVAPAATDADTSALVADPIPAELRDAVPIATAAVWPVLALLTGTLGWLSPLVAQLLAAGWIVLRLALTGVIVERLSDRRASAAAIWGGVGLAAVSALIAVAKAFLTH